jgi:hypothetical protein
MKLPERVVSSFESNETEIFQLMQPFVMSYPAAYQTLSQAMPITCAMTGATFDAVPAPAAVIMDVRLSFLCAVIANHKSPSSVLCSSSVACNPNNQQEFRPSLCLHHWWRIDHHPPVWT